MVGLTQIGQVSSQMDPQTRRLLDALINGTDQWITAGSLSVHVSSEVISAVVKVTGDGSSRFTITPDDGHLSEWPSDVVGAVVAVSSNDYVVVKRDSDTVVTVSAATNSISTLTAGTLNKPAPESNRIGKIDFAAAEGANAGDILYYSNSVGQYVRLPIGSTSDVLTVTGGVPVWADAGSGPAGPPGDDGDDGADGADGKTVLNGTATPTSGTGTVGDFYIDTDDNEIYGPKAGSGETPWGSATSLVGPAGADGADGANGNDGDDGADGKTVLNGSGLPDNASDGSVGDFYIRTSTNEIYGPKTSGGWGDATSLVGATGAAGVDGNDGNDGDDGADGKTVLNGAVAPTDQGSVGDFYIDTTNDNIYGPKTSGGTPWGSPTSLVGPIGATGADGADGAATLNELSDVSYTGGDLTITGLDTIVAGAITIDSSANITLDAAGGTIQFADAGVSLGTITSSGYSGTAAKVTVTDSTEDIAFPVTFYNSSTLGLHRHTDGLTYNPSNLVRQISGPLSIVGLDSDHNATGNSLTIEGGHTVNGTTVDGTGLSNSEDTTSTFEVADATGIAEDDILSVGAENMTVTAIDVGSNPNSLTVTRGTSGSKGSHSDGASLFVFNDVKGGDLILRGGPGKGTEPGGAVKIQTTEPLGTTTTGLNSYPSLDGILVTNTSITKPARIGTNQEGFDLSIAAGQGTGTAKGGKLSLSASRLGTTGTNPNALMEGVVVSSPTADADTGVDVQVGILFDPSSDDAYGPLTIEGAPETSDRYLLGMTTTYFEDTGHQSGAVFSVNASPTGNSDATTYGLFMDCGTTAPDTRDYSASEAFVGGKFTVRHRGEGEVSRMAAASFAISTDDGTVLEAVGVSIETMKQPGVTTAYGIKQGTAVTASGDINFFAGPICIGGDTTIPDTPLDVDGAITVRYKESSTAVLANVPAGTRVTNAETFSAGTTINQTVAFLKTAFDDSPAPRTMEVSNQAVFNSDAEDILVVNPNGDFECMSFDDRTNVASPDFDTLSINAREKFGTETPDDDFPADTTAVRQVLVNTSTSVPFTLSVADASELSALGDARIQNTVTEEEEYVTISAVDESANTATISARSLNGSTAMVIAGTEEIKLLSAYAVTLPAECRMYVKNTHMGSDPSFAAPGAYSNLIIKTRADYNDATDLDRYSTLRLDDTTQVGLATQSAISGTVNDSSSTGLANCKINNSVTKNTYHGTITIPSDNIDGEFDNALAERFTVLNDRVKEGDLVLVGFANDYCPVLRFTASPEALLDSMFYLQALNVIDGSFQIQLLNLQLPTDQFKAETEMKITFRVIPSTATFWNASTTEP